MKKLLYILLIVQTVAFTTGCKKDLSSEGVSKLSIKITLKGSTLITIPRGGTYTEPGYTAEDGNTKADVTTEVKIDGTVDTQTTGYYEITYSAVNSDGIPISALRKVIIYDPAAPKTDITGNYLGKVTRNTSTNNLFNGLSVSISKLAPGFFEVTDLLGGYYDQGRVYGSAYAMGGYIQLNTDNSITLVSSYMPGFGDSLSSLTNGKYDPATKIVSWNAGYAGYKFVITLTLAQ